jgi:hypothetical protein
MIVKHQFHLGSDFELVYGPVGFEKELALGGLVQNENILRPVPKVHDGKLFIIENLEEKIFFDALNRRGHKSPGIFNPAGIRNSSESRAGKEQAAPCSAPIKDSVRETPIK